MARIETIKKQSTGILFNNMIASIKILARSKFKHHEPFIYNDGKRDVACVVNELGGEITLLYN